MSKTNLGLVEYARSKIGTPYIYGAKMEVLTQAKFKYLQNTYGKSCVWDSDAKKIGQVCCDCSGLISAYTGVVLGSSQMKSKAKKVNPISTIKNASIGALVWMPGHIGIYSGLKDGVPYYIAEDGSAYGCRETKLSNNKFTHWFKDPNITYITETKEVSTTSTANTVKAKAVKPTKENVNISATTVVQASPAKPTDYKITESNLNLLVQNGVILSPDYWKNQNIEHLNTLINNISPVLNKSLNHGIEDFDTAIKKLVDAKLIVSPDYWIEKAKSVKYLDLLIINMVNKCKGV